MILGALRRVFGGEKFGGDFGYRGRHNWRSSRDMERPSRSSFATVEDQFTLGDGTEPDLFAQR